MASKHEIGSRAGVRYRMYKARQCNEQLVHNPTKEKLWFLFIEGPDGNKGRDDYAGYFKTKKEAYAHIEKYGVEILVFRKPKDQCSKLRERVKGSLTHDDVSKARDIFIRNERLNAGQE